MFSIENRSLERSTIELIEREPTREEKRRVEGVGKKRGREAEEARWEKREMARNRNYNIGSLEE